MAGLVFVTSATFTSVTELIVNNCFTSTYRNYYGTLFIETTSANNSGGEIRLRSGGVDNTATEYYRQDMRVDGSSFSAARVTNDKGFFFRSDDTGVACADLYFYNPAVATETMMRSLGGDMAGSSGLEHEQYAVRHNVASSLDGFHLLFGSTMSGTLELYGYGLS